MADQMTPFHREHLLVQTSRNVLRMLNNELEGNARNSRDEFLHQARALYDALSWYGDLPPVRDADKYDPILDVHDPRRI
jgi:hypothetical protein